MDKFKINFDKEACIGCIACASVCDNWIMDENKAKPKKTTISEKELKSNKKAESICPVNAIKIKEV
ncbi:ferredoxin [Candidatus Pacearchaeota archaeon]|nr:ferredoxin [Candidatus Pacearchaeota archaeon]